MPRAIVIGGSLGGLFAANLLRSAGWDAVVFERAEADLAGRGAGLGTRAELFSIMRRIGTSPDLTAGVQIRSRLCLDGDGAIECEAPISSVATAWDRIYRALKAVLPREHYRAGVEFRHLEQKAGLVTAFFSDGSRTEGDLLIAADGIHSSVRKQVSVATTPRYAGYVGWRGVANVADLPTELHELVLCHMNFCFPEGELALSVPMPALAADEPASRVQITWFRPVDRELELPRLCTDETGRCHGVTIAPPLVRKEVIAELRSRAGILAPQMATLFRAVRQPLLQPIFDLESPRLVYGRVVLLGDAAFVARPHVGTGVTKAALDAAALTDALRAHSTSLDQALAEYERDRIDFGTRLVARGQRLGAYLTTQQIPRDQRCREHLYRRPMTIIQQFGATGDSLSENSAHAST
jgi:2-polyprenyl-6-methoxyphenol hydroxylase-like FAD-dependent oxidoreductase